MAEAVNILNSRPLTQNSDSPLDEQPLTPNHLFHLPKMTSAADALRGKPNIWLIYSGADERVSE